MSCLSFLKTFYLLKKKWNSTSISEFQNVSGRHMLTKFFFQEQNTLFFLSGCLVMLGIYFKSLFVILLNKEKFFHLKIFYYLFRVLGVSLLFYSIYYYHEKNLVKIIFIFLLGYFSIMFAGFLARKRILR